MMQIEGLLHHKKMRFCNIDVDSKYDQIREISTDEEELHKKN
jgi:hypothetical protein